MRVERRKAAELMVVVRDGGDYRAISHLLKVHVLRLDGLTRDLVVVRVQTGDWVIVLTLGRSMEKEEKFGMVILKRVMEHVGSMVIVLDVHWTWKERA